MPLVDPRVPLAPGVRAATQDDLAEIHAMIIELADFERSAEQVVLTPEQLRTALFGPAASAACLIAEHDQLVAGFALYYGYFSTWQGQGLYLEDLFVRPAARGAGLGTALLRSLAMIATAQGCTRLDWSVLDWNRPAIDFYDSLGAAPLGEWIRYRLSGSALGSLATRT